MQSCGISTFTLGCLPCHVSSTISCPQRKLRTQQTLTPHFYSTPLLATTLWLYLSVNLTNLDTSRKCHHKILLWLGYFPRHDVFRFINTVACVRVFFLCEADFSTVRINPVLLIHPSVHTWVASNFRLLGIMLQRTWVCNHLSPCFHFF